MIELSQVVILIQMPLVLYGLRQVIRCVYRQIKKREPLTIVAISRLHLRDAERDIQALRATFDSDQLIELTELRVDTLKRTLQLHNGKRVNLHVGCHCTINGQMQFDDQLIDAYQFIELLPSGGIDTMSLMCCYGENVASLITGANAVKNVICTEYTYAIPNTEASLITKVFWAAMQRNSYMFLTAYRQTHKRLPYEVSKHVRYHRRS